MNGASSSSTSPSFLGTHSPSCSPRSLCANPTISVSHSFFQHGILRLELVVWLVPHLISSAICIAFVGFFLGPIYPIVMNHAGRILPQELISGGIGWISSFGSAGAAAFPFITGAIASGTNIGSLQPL